MRKCRSGLGEDAVTALRETPGRREFSRWPHPPAVCFAHLHYLAPVGKWTCLFTLSHSINKNLQVFICHWILLKYRQCYVGMEQNLLDFQQLSFECGKNTVLRVDKIQVITTGSRKPSKPSRDPALKVLNPCPKTTLKAHFDWLNTSGISLASCLDKWINFSSN